MEEKKDFQKIEEKFNWKKDDLLPDEAFASKLEQELIRQAQATTCQAKPNRASLVWGALAVTMAALFLAVLIIGPQKVYARLQKLFGYVENFGVVSSETPLRVLKKEVTQSKEGITLRVSEALLGDDFTRIHYAFEGEKLAGEVITAMPGEDSCRERGEIVLSDGRVIGISEPIPEDENRVELRFACIPDAVMGKAPEGWSVWLEFEAAPERMQVHQVRSLVTETRKPIRVTETLPETEIQTERPEATAELTPAPVEEELVLKIKEYVETDVSYILHLVIESYIPNGWTLMTGIPKILDANGTELVLQFPDGKFEPLSPIEPRNDGEYTQHDSWTLEISKQNLALPLRIQLESVSFVPLMQEALPKESFVSFDLGQAQVNSAFIVDKTVLLEGEVIVIDNVTVTEYGYQLSTRIEGKLNAFDLEVEECNGVGGGGPGMGWFDPPSHDFSIFCSNSPLPREITLKLSNATKRLDPRQWQVGWSPE